MTQNTAFKKLLILIEFMNLNLQKFLIKFHKFILLRFKEKMWLLLFNNLFRI